MIDINEPSARPPNTAQPTGLLASAIIPRLAKFPITHPALIVKAL